MTAWLAPLFLLLFARAGKPLPGLGLIWLVLFAAYYVAYRGVAPLPEPAYLAIIAATATSASLPFALDRLLSPHLPGLASTLVFPLAWVTVELLTTRLSQFGAGHP
ncbi:MAG TPA: hypothetical protein VGW38_15710 [Chloroflexota bacterium]|nr:hypothetical protein [Chloroflexota bacterium]